MKSLAVTGKYTLFRVFQMQECQKNKENEKKNRKMPNYPASPQKKAPLPTRSGEFNLRNHENTPGGRRPSEKAEKLKRKPPRTLHCKSAAATPALMQRNAKN